MLLFSMTKQLKTNLEINGIFDGLPEKATNLNQLFEFTLKQCQCVKVLIFNLIQLVYQGL